MMRYRAVVALTVLVAGTATIEGQTTEIVVLVDDLHIDFRSTPRLRETLARRVLPPLSGHPVGLVTTGHGSAWVAPTTDTAALIAGVRLATGNALRPEDLLQQSQVGTEERIRRARIAVSTARDVVKALAERATQAVVIYISGGYADADLATDLAELAAAANQANLRIYAFDYRSILDWSVPGVTQSNEPAWSAYTLEAQHSLRLLAERTGGQLVSARSEIDAVVTDIARDVSKH